VLMLRRRAYELLLDVLGHFFFPLLTLFLFDRFFVLLQIVSTTR